MLFQYTQLAKDSIRVVRFLPYSTSSNLYLSLEHITGISQGNIRYSALSYDSVNSAEEKKSVTLGGRSFLVTETLFAALSTIRAARGTTGCYWVDQLSINHRDDREVHEQRQSMPKIFSIAEEALVWLPSADEDMKTALADLRSPENGVPILQSRFLSPEDAEILLDSAIQRKDIKKALCKPEVLQSKKIVLLCDESEYVLRYDDSPREGMSTL